MEPEAGVVIPDYSRGGELMCGMLAVLFGKRFDFHGMTQGSGHFQVPEMAAFSQLCDPRLPQNTHRPRTDFGVELDLGELVRIEPLALFDGSVAEEIWKPFHSAAKFYLQALQTVERDPEVAYLHLISSLEILAGNFDYPKEELWDADLAALLEEIRAGMKDGARVAERVASRLYQVKRAFVRTVTDLIDDQFFYGSDVSVPAYALQQVEFEKSIAAAYDLRSLYVHTGSPFGRWIDWPDQERPLGKPVLNDKSLRKALERAPTYQGLERVTRYCLIRFLDIKGVYAAPHGPKKPAPVVTPTA
jgi:hypothetical protein